MTNPMADLAPYTDKELEQAMARILTHALREVLNDTDVQKLWQLHQEIQRRRAPSSRGKPKNRVNLEGIGILASNLEISGRKRAGSGWTGDEARPVNLEGLSPPLLRAQPPASIIYGCAGCRGIA